MPQTRRRAPRVGAAVLLGSLALTGCAHPSTPVVAPPLPPLECPVLALVRPRPVPLPAETLVLTRTGTLATVLDVVEAVTLPHGSYPVEADPTPRGDPPSVVPLVQSRVRVILAPSCTRVTVVGRPGLLVHNATDASWSWHIPRPSPVASRPTAPR